MEKTCEIESSGNSLQNIWNAITSQDGHQINDVAFQICTLAHQNYITATIIGIGLPFLESFFPMLPYSGFVFFNVSIFGPLVGFFLSLIGTVSGGLILFLAIRFFLQARMIAFLEKHNQTAFYEKLSRGVDKHGIIYVFLVYGIFGLIIPSSLCTISFGLTNFSKKEYFIGLIAGKAFVTALIVLFGHAILKYLSSPILLVVLGIALLVGIFVMKKFGTKFDLE